MLLHEQKRVISHTFHHATLVLLVLLFDILATPTSSLQRESFSMNVRLHQEKCHWLYLRNAQNRNGLQGCLRV